GEGGGPGGGGEGGGGAGVEAPSSLAGAGVEGGDAVLTGRGQDQEAVGDDRPRGAVGLEAGLVGPGRPLRAQVAGPVQAEVERRGCRSGGGGRGRGGRL